MKYPLTFFFLISLGFLSGQSNFQREYGLPSERSQDVAVEVLVDASTVTAVYSSEGGIAGQSTLEFVRTNPDDGSIISQTNIPYPFISTTRTSSVVLEDSILVIARLEEDRVIVSRLNTQGELLANFGVPISSNGVNNFRLVAAPDQAVALMLELPFQTAIWYLDPALPFTRVTTINSASRQLFDFTVMPDKNYLFYTNQGGGLGTFLVDSQTGNIIEENPLPDSDNAENFAGSRFLTDPTDGSTVLALLAIQEGTRLPYIYRLDSVGRAIGAPYTLGQLPPDSWFLYGFSPSGQLVYSVRNLAFFAYPDYRQPNNQALPIASLPDDFGRNVGNPKVGYAANGEIYYHFTSCRGLGNCDVVLTRSELSIEKWRNRLGTPGRATNDLATLIDTDPQGNIYLLSRSPNEEGTDETTTVRKLDPDGNSIWLRSLTTAQGDATRPLTMVFRGDGLLLVQHSVAGIIYTDVLAPDGASAHAQFSVESLDRSLLSGRIKAIDLGGGVVLSANVMGTETALDIHRTDGSRRSIFTLNNVSAPNALARLEDDFVMIMGRENGPLGRFTLVKYDLMERREIWSLNLGSPTTSDAFNFAEDLIVLPDGNYLLAASTVNFRSDDTEGIHLYRISPEGTVELTANQPQVVFDPYLPVHLAVNAQDEPILISYTGTGDAKIFRTNRLNPNDLSVLETTDIILPALYAPAGNFTFSRNGFALAYGTVYPEGDRLGQLIVISEKVIDNPVSSSLAPTLEADIDLYPNPSSGPVTITVNLRNASPLKIEVIDATARTIHSFTRPAGLLHHVYLSEEDLPTGISFVRITDERGDQRSLRLVRH